MGNAAPRAQPPSQLDSASQYRTYLMDYSPRSMIKIVFVSLIGDGKFLKTIYCKSDEGSLVVKIYRKYDPNESLSSAEVALRRLSLAFSMEHQPNLLPYADYQLSTKYNVAFMVRQYFASNLYDRICSRPFLTTIEKKWIAFQVLRALEQCHNKGICHGDIKQENILVTSWNWIFLTDFAPFKPTYIPEDDPADYNYYFSAIDATRRSCCVAPERFYGNSSAATSGASSQSTNGTRGPDAMMLSRLADSELSVEDVDKQFLSMNATPTSAPSSTAPASSRNRREGNLLESMDIFSAGCVIAEVFLGGKPLFDLPALLRYRTGDVDSLRAQLKKVEDLQLEEMLLHMLQLDPRARSSASEYLARYTSTSSGLFPSYFESFLFRFLVLVLGRGGKIPDARIRLVCKYYGRLVKEIAGVDDIEGEDFFKLRLKEGFGSDRHMNTEGDQQSHVAQRVLEELEQRMPSKSDKRTDKENLSSSRRARAQDDSMILNGALQKKKIEKLHDQYNALTEKKNSPKSEPTYDGVDDSTGNDTHLNADDGNNPEDESANLKKPKKPARDRTKSSGSSSRSQEPFASDKNGIMIILSLVCSSLRHVQVPESKITALYLIRSLGQFTTDEVRLQRLLPFLLEVVDDSSATVRALSIRIITGVLAMVKTVPLSDASVFPQYILPAVSSMPSDPDEMVRIAFAECLPSLAATSRRFLEIAHAMKQKSLAASATSSSSSSSTRNNDNAITTLYLASNSFDKELNRLHKMISRFVIQLAAPDQKSSSSLVKRALLVDITRLCVFFGRERTLDVVLPQLITFLNDRDWELRGSFFDHIVGLCSFVGRVTVELYILPCIEQALIDVQEIVITKAVACLDGLCQLGLFQKNTTALIEKAKLTCFLLLHPSWWIRDAVLKLMSHISLQLGSVDANVFLSPVLRPFLKQPMVFLGNEDARDILARLTDSCRPHVSRETFDAALVASSAGNVDIGELFEIESFVAVPGTESNEAKTPESGNRRNREPLSSVDSLDNYTSAKLPPSAPTSLIRTDSTVNTADAFEKRKNELYGLKLMQKYIGSASMHMRSKMELAHSEQAARLHGKADRSAATSALSSSTSAAFAKKMSRSHIHVLHVPDMRYALSIAQPIRGGNLVIATPGSVATPAASGIPPSGKSQANPQRNAGGSTPAGGAAASAMWENLSLALIVKMYGLSAPNLPVSAYSSSPQPSSTSSTPAGPSAAYAFSATGIAQLEDASYHSGVPATTFLDSNHFAPGGGLMVSMLNMNMYGGDGVGMLEQYPMSPSKRAMMKKSYMAYHHHQYLHRESTADPALTNPRKLLARLTALGVPPLPPDLGSLRLSDGTPFSIYSVGPQGAYVNTGATATSPASNDRAGPNATSSSPVASSFSGGTFGTAPSSSMNSTSGLSQSGSSSTGFGMYSQSNRNWKPRKNVLVAELAEHTGAVGRIGSAQDYSFLASASNDGTVKLWSVRSLQHSVNQGSRCTYDAQGGVLTDMVVLDNCHSVASASSNGTVHVFRVDKVNSPGGNFHASGLKEIRAENSAVMVLDHLNNVSESLLIYATRSGSIHAWDLRMRREAWKLEVSPELGYVTCMTHSLDVSWFAAGTSRGYICLWDLRFLVLIRIWRHSTHRAIHRLKPCLGLPNTLLLEETSVPLVFVAAGDGEVAVFDLSIGACRAIFRTLHVQSSDADACKCPTLLHVPIPHRSRSVLGSFLGIYGIATAFDDISTTPLSEEPAVRAMLCPGLHLRGVGDALITGGEDKQIRYWDIRQGKQSFTVCGNGESKSFYDNQAPPSDWWRMSPAANQQLHASRDESAIPLTTTSAISKPEMAWSKLSPPIITICQDSSYFAAQGSVGPAVASSGGVESAVTMERRGLVPPSPAHNDCILDLALVDLNGQMLVSSGRDGLIKVWK
ncbi:TPA: hypothetical protein N0F65_005015 [Lagenidium giganteum]|uniref:non-specific serine/threonine protein kinase n=1 Tax=Lagenidium giganteum TaxID=4803 RepID=A0AAV2ZR97_9STRA|nr:TPA: hypothetical protein N0F65_005015 [Lagenidium giganteum]